MSTVGIPDQRAQPKGILLSVVLSSMLLNFFSAFGAQAVIAQEPRWSEPRPLSEGNGAGSVQALAVDPQGCVHAVWIRDANGDEYEDSILYSVWDGIKWSPPVDIFYTSQGGPFIPAITSDSRDYLHVLFDWRGVEGIYHMQAAIDGARSATSWSVPTTINTGGHAYFSYVVTDGRGTIHAIWEDRSKTLDVGEILYSQMDSNEGEWSEPINVSKSPLVMSTHPQIVVNGRQQIFVTWTEGDYGEMEGRYARSTDGGSTWDEAGLIAVDGQERGPALFLDSAERPHVVWAGRGGSAILHASWDEGGWSESTLITNQGWSSSNPWIRGVSDSGGDLHVLWRFAQEDPHIYYSMSEDNGLTWSSATVMAEGNWRVDVASRLGNQVVAVWAWYDRLYYSILETNDFAWTPMPRLSSPETEIRPALTSGPTASPTTMARPSPTTTASREIRVDPERPTTSGSDYFGLLLGIGAVCGVMGMVLLVGSLRKNIRL